MPAPMYSVDVRDREEMFPLESTHFLSLEQAEEWISNHSDTAWNNTGKATVYYVLREATNMLEFLSNPRISYYNAQGLKSTKARCISMFI